MVSRAGQSRVPKTVRIAVDVVMGCLFVAVVSTALVQEAPHEYLALALFAFIVAHIVLHRRWFATLFRGKYNLVRVLQLIAVVGLIVCVMGQIASALVLSKYAFGFLPALPGAAIARRVHMSCSYWAFVFAFAHAGFQLKGPGRLMRKADLNAGSGDDVPRASRLALWAARIVFVVIACFGVFFFVQLNLGAYLLLQVEFSFADYSVPTAFAFVRYACIAVLIAGIFHYLRRAIEQIIRK